MGAEDSVQTKKSLLDGVSEGNLALHLLHNTSDLVLVLDIQSHIVYINPAAQKRLGSIRERKLSTLVREDMRYSVENAVLDMITTTENTVTLSLHMAAGYFQSTLSHIKLQGDIFALCVAKDVSKTYKSNQRLYESEARYRLIAENSLDIISENLLDGTTLYVSPAAFRVTGFTVEERMGQSTFDRVHPDDIGRIRNGISQLVETGQGRMTFRYQCKSGDYIYLEAVARRVQNPYVYEGKPFMVVVSRDVSERVTMMQELENSVREKEILLSEIHHRVKNNLQIISSLLSLQSQFVKDPESHAIFFDCQSRIKSIALIHETLYQNRNLSRIDFANYLNNLADRLSGSYLGNSNRVSIDVLNSNVFLPIDLAISCGLIVNELVTNALKYAFPDEREGQIDIAITYDEEDAQFCLTVADNGIGIPDHVHLDNPETLGLQLVTTLAQQLDAMITVDNHKGTTFKLYFSVLQERGSHDS